MVKKRQKLGEYKKNNRKKGVVYVNKKTFIINNLNLGNVVS